MKNAQQLYSLYIEEDVCPTYTRLQDGRVSIPYAGRTHHVRAVIGYSGLSTSSGPYAMPVFLKWGYVYPWGYSEVLQGVLERKWNVEKIFLLLLNVKTHLCEHAAL